MDLESSREPKLLAGDAFPNLGNARIYLLARLNLLSVGNIVQLVFLKNYYRQCQRGRITFIEFPE